MQNKEFAGRFKKDYLDVHIDLDDVEMTLLDRR